MARDSEFPAEQIGIVLTMLTRAARAGDKCPGNALIAAALGTGTGRASEYVGELERRGLIRVTRYNSARVVTIIETGQSTRSPPRAAAIPHHSARGRSAVVDEAAPVVGAAAGFASCSAERLVRSGRGGTIRRIARDRALVSVSATVEAEIADVVAAQAAAWGQSPGAALRNLILMGIEVARDEAA